MLFTKIQKDPSPPGTLFVKSPPSPIVDGTDLITSLQWNNLIDILDGTSTEKIPDIALNNINPSKITGTAVINSDPRLSDSRTPLAHTHPKTEISDTGTWEVAEIPNLPISKTTGLQSTLDGKSAIGHTHTASEITDYATAVAGFTNKTIDVEDATNIIKQTIPVAGEYLRDNGTKFVSSTILAGDLPSGIDSSKLADGSVSNIELQFIGTLSSNAQVQLDGKENTLGFTPENVANKGAVSGYCPLDASQKTPIANLPTGTTALTVTVGNDVRLSDARTPLTHAASHKSGGGDAIKLDELDTPTDVTTLNASPTAHGLLPKLENTTTKFLRDDGTWQIISGAGESNTSSNAVVDSATQKGLAKAKVGVDLPFKVIQTGSPKLTIATDLNNVTLDVATGTTSSTVTVGDDVRLSDSRNPLAHAISHKTGGSDSIKLDELTLPNDNTTLDATTLLHGLMPKADKVKLDGIAANANNYVHPNHSGDVTSVGDGLQTIANGAVTYAKIQNVSATSRLLGRKTIGAGVVEELTGADVNTITGAEVVTNKNAVNGYAGLDGSSKLTGSQQLYGTIANTACEGNDPRLSDTRTPTDASVTDAKIAAGADVMIASIEFIIDGGGSAITTGEKGVLEIPFNCTIDRVTLLADQTGSIVIDIWKNTYALYPPTVANTITATAKPTITAATKSQDATLTGWNKTIVAGDILKFNVDSNTTLQQVTLSLKVTKT